MDIPKPEYCRQLCDQYAVPITVRKHLEKVRDVGEVLADGLIKAGVTLDSALIEAGCLIHDAFKAASLEKLTPVPQFNYKPSERELEMHRQLRAKYTGIHETLVAADIVRPEFPEFADFVANIGSTGNPTYFNEDLTWAKELQVVHYADWRVQWDQIVSFDDRLEYLKKTYLGINHPDKGESWWTEALNKEKALEIWIFKHLNFQPDELASRLK